MFWVAVQLGLLAVSLIATYYMRPEVENARAASLNDFDVPRAEEGDAVPLAYGTCRISSSIVVYFDVLSSEEHPIGSPVIVSYRYNVAMRVLLCRSNVRVGQVNPPRPLMTGLYIGEQRARLTGPFEDPAHPGAYTGGALAGSGNETDGQTGGFLIFYDGRWDLTRVAGDVDGTDVGNDVPYRGYLTLRFTGWYVDGPTIAPYSPVIFNPCVIPGYESQTGALGTGDCNPVAILYDLLTNPWGGIGNDTALIDETSFLDCAAVLADESFGMSLLVTKPNEARTVIEEVLRTIDAMLYCNMDTGKYVLKLIREDYNPATLPVYDTTNVLDEPEKSNTLWSETFNEVKIIFTDPLNSYRTTTATAQDMAGIAINGGRVRSTEIRYSGVRSPDLANKLANRELNFLCRPIDSLRIRVNREGYNLKPGDVFRFTWAPWSNYTGIFRVIDADFGTLEDGAITVNAIQDRFSTVGTIWDPSNTDEVNVPTAPPTAIVHRLATECPRWIQSRAWDLGQINNAEAQRGLFVAVPEGSDSRYRVDSEIDGDDAIADLPARSFPVTFTVALTYAKTTDTYDTTSHITVENLDGGTFGSATAAQIRATGRNMFVLWDDDGHHEVLAYEAAADLGGGQYQLQNVWRGLLDTVPHAWAAGSFGAVLPGTSGTSAMGRAIYSDGAAVVATTMAAAGSSWTPTDDSPSDSFTARSRVLLPARGADLLVNGSVAPSALEEDGVTFTWTDRNATTGTVVRGDAADEALQAGQTFDAVGYKGGLPDDGTTQVVISAGFSSHTTKLSTAIVGHGALDLGVDTKRTITLPDSSTTVARGWQVPTFAVTAHHWRNLLLNPRFDDGGGSLTYWTTTNASVASATPLGGTGYYARGTVGAGNATLSQTIDVTGYTPSHMAARLSFYARKLTDSSAPDDTVTVVLENLTSGGASISTTTYGPSAPTTWEYNELELTNLDATTAKLKVTITLTANGFAGDTDADAGITELCLRLGQQSAQLLLNPSFESGGGSITNWTETVGGTWQVFAVTAYESGYYLQPQNVASAQLRQSVTLPAGYTWGVAILEFARKNAAADDTGTVTLEALDGGGAVLDSVTTGAEALTPSNWARRRLVLDPIPEATVNLRVTIDAARVTGTPLDACFDDFRLVCHKHLDVDETIEAEWSESVAQRLPRTATAWAAAFPTVDPPDYAIYDGAATGRLGIEPVLQSTDATTALLGATAIAWDGTSRTTTAYEGTSAGAGSCIEMAPSGTAFGNFHSADPFTVLVAFRVRPGAPLGDSFGIVGRMVDGVGWEIRLTDTDAYPEVRITGDGGMFSITGSQSCADGGTYLCALVNVGNGTLWLYDQVGNHDDSAVAAGEIYTTTPGKLRILFANETEAASLEGQVLRVYMWRSALTETDLNTILNYRTSDPSGLITTDSRTGSIACVTGVDDDGNVQVEVFGAGRTPIAYDTASQRWGLVTMPAMDELVCTATSTTDTGTVTDDYAIDPLGFLQAIRLNGTNAQGRKFNGLSPGGAATIYVTFMAKASAAHSMRVTLDSAGVDDTADVVLSTLWQVFTVELAWDGGAGNPNMALLFSGSNDGTTREAFLSPMIAATLVKPYPGTFPIGSPGATAPRLDVSALTAQVNHEGELAIEAAMVDVDATIGDLWNGTNDNDRRTVRYDATGPNIESDHADGTGTVNTNAQINTTAVTVTDPATYRLRWCRAGVLDGGAMQVRLRAEQGATIENDTGRNATWTPSTTAVDTLDLGHEDGSGVMAGLVHAVTITSRERKIS